MWLKILLLISFITITASAQQIPPLPYKMGAGSAEVYNNNIYTFGGSIDWGGHVLLYDSVFVYNGTSWSFADTIPDKNLWDVETVRVGNEVYMISGWPGGANYLRKFNLDTYEWTYLANSPNTTTWGVAAEYYNGHIFLFNPSGNVYDYSIANNQWTTKTNAGVVSPLNLSSIIFQDEIYLIGFSDSTFMKYNPALDQWIPLAKSPYPVGASAMGIINDKIYNIGGNVGGGSDAYYKSVIVYDITQNRWDLDSLQISGKRHWMATAEYQGGLYILGGLDSSALAVDIVEEIVPQGTDTIHTAINDVVDGFPKEYKLLQNYPNPFNPTTIINYELRITNFVRLAVYDALGREIETLVNKYQNAGNYQVTFDGSSQASGIYYYKITAGNFIQTRKMLLLK
jgi:N-acetylneuraminic acid mutarotase